jgi:hypothetical protein
VYTSVSLQSQNLSGSPLAPLEKGGTGSKGSEVPLTKGDLGESRCVYTVAQEGNRRSAELKTKRSKLIPIPQP